MHKRNKRPPCRKIVLKLPDLDHAKSAVLNSLSSPHSRRNYKFAMEQFITWYCSEPPCGSQATGIRRCRFRLAQSGTRCGNSPGQRSEAAWSPHRELADARPSSAHGGAKLGDSGEIAFCRTTHDILCILGQELASERTVQSLKRVRIKGSDDTLDRSAVQGYVVGIAIHERDPISVHAHIGLITGQQYSVCIA